MTIRDNQLLRIPGFAQGINNVADADSMPRAESGAPLAVREAVNVDLGPAGKPRRRAGWALAKALTDPHSGFGDWPDALLCVAGNALVALDANLGSTTVRAGVGPAAISYAVVNDDCFWTNGTLLRKVTPELVDRHAAVTCPTQPTVAAYNIGGLAAGDYQVAVTCMDADGEESGSTLATMVTVAEGGGIRLTNLQAPAEAAWVRVYVSGCNGDQLYHVRDVPAGIAQWTIGHGPRGKLLETQWLLPLAPGRILRLFNGRLFVADATGLRWSEPLRYGYTRADNYLRYRNTALCEPAGQGASAGLFVANDRRTLWLPGPDPKAWQQIIARPAGAVPGTGRQVPANWFGLDAAQGNVAFWMDTDGVFCLGLPSGQVLPLTEGRVALPEYAQGAVLLQEKPGIRQIIAALIGGGANRMAASDSAVATIRKHGDAADL